MLNPQEIADKVFEKAVFGGYHMPMVDEFLESVSNDYAALYKENAILKSKLKVLVEKVEEYRSTEDSMRMALLTAQRMGEELISEANKKREETIQSADSEARERLAETERRTAEEEMRLSAAVKDTTKFIEFSHAIMRKHSDFLSKLERARDTVAQEVPPMQTQEAEAVYAPQPVYAQEGEYEGASWEGQATDSPTQAFDISGGYSEPVYEQEQAVPQTVAAPQQEEVRYDDASAPTISYSIKDIRHAEDEPGVPPPSFDLDNLKFGTNFNDNEQ